MVDFSGEFDIITLLFTRDNADADWCNGSTADSDSVSRGSSPLSVVKNLRLQVLNYFYEVFLRMPRIGVWLSLVERYVRDVEVACSNHVTPI